MLRRGWVRSKEFAIAIDTSFDNVARGHMPVYKVTNRPGLGPRVDPTYDAEVGRTLAALQAGQSVTSSASGYIELFGADTPDAGSVRLPYDDLKALFAVVYGLPRRANRIFGRFGRSDPVHVWTQISQLRYLTTDADTGIAIPLYSFNPPTNARAWPLRSSTQLDRQLERLERLTGGKLAAARMIGLTVDFDFTVNALRLLSALLRTSASTRDGEELQQDACPP